MLAGFNILSDAATFPVLSAETRIPTNGPVAISGDTAIVGNLIYQRTPEGWLFQQVLAGFGPLAEQGNAALDGNTMLVGTNIYSRTADGRWELQGTLPFSSGLEGETAAIHQDWIAIGNPNDYNSNGVAIGAVYIYERTNSTWVLQSRLTPNDPENAIGFGSSVALDGNILVVGAPANIYAYPDVKPRAYIFSRDGESWIQEAELTNGLPDSSNFADTVGISGNTVAVGGNEPEGSVALFTRSVGQWIKSRQTLSLGQTVIAGHWLNTSPLAMHGNGLAVADASGIVHVFERNNSTWKESQTLRSEGTNNFVTAVSLSTNALIVGSSDPRSRNTFIYEAPLWTWQEQDIGDTGAQGSFNGITNSLLISGAGADIGGTADAFHYVFRPYTNDLEMTVHVLSVGGSDSYSRGGIMFRSSLDAGSPFVFVCLRQGQQIFFQYRTETNVQGVLNHGPWVGAPYWLRLRKLGTNVVASGSDDGSVWYDLGSVNLNLPDSFYIGLAVTSEKSGILATDVFDDVDIAPIAVPEAVSNLTATTTGVDSIHLSWTANSSKASQFVVKRAAYNYYYPVASVPGNTTNFTDVRLAHNTNYSYIVQALEPHGYGSDSEVVSATTWKLPTPWLDQDIGAVQLPGGASYRGFDPFRSGFAVHSGATNASMDGLHFVYQKWTGDFDFKAQADIELYLGALGAKAGLMIRSSLDALSPYAFLCMTESNGDCFVTGNMPGSSTVSASGRWTRMFRIVRRGNTFTVFHMDPGVFGLVEMTTQTLDLPSTIYLGFAVTGGNLGFSSYGDFFNIGLVGGSDVHPISTPTLTAQAISPTQVRLSWTDSNVNTLSYGVVYFQTNNGLPLFYSVTPGLSTNVTSFVDTSVVPGMSKNYRMEVQLADGDWIWSNLAPVTTPYPVNNLPSDWLSARMGFGGTITASVSESNRTFFLKGVGQSIGGLSDDCTGIFRQLSGDGIITVRLVELRDTTGITYPLGKFGLMMRQSTDPSAQAAAVFETRSPFYGKGFMSRTNPGTSGQVGLTVGDGANWLKLVRTGQSITGYNSNDGTNWTLIGSASIPMSDPVLVGVFAESETNSPLASATFDNLQIGPAQASALAFSGFDPNGAARVKLQGFPGWTNWIEVSPDLAHWEPWTNSFNVSGSLEIVDPAARTNSSRFYRVRIEQ